MILVIECHAAPATYTHDTKIKVKQQKCPGFKFKHQQVNKRYERKAQSFPLMSPLTTKRRSSRRGKLQNQQKT
jgi:hypothetical protein